MKISKTFTTCIENEEQIIILTAFSKEDNPGGNFSATCAPKIYTSDREQEVLKYELKAVCVNAWNKLSQLKQQSPLLLQMINESGNVSAFPIDQDYLRLPSFEDALELVQQVELLLTVNSVSN